MPRLSSFLGAAQSVALLVIVAGGPIARGEQVSDGSPVAVGVEGHYRVGRWTGVRLSEGAPFSTIETRDGDGVQVEYQQPSLVTSGGWGYAIPGSEAAPIVLSHNADVVRSSRFPTRGSPSRGPAMIPLETPWIVAFGDPLGIDQIGANKLLDRDAQIAVSKPTSASGIPDSVLGYDGVDMMLIGGSSTPVLRALSESQQRALSRWITDGGRLFLTLGESAPELMAAAPWLQALLPIDELTTIRLDPSAIETYTSTQTPLDSYTGLELPKDQGRVLILGRTTRRVSTPIAVEYNIGFGRVTVVTADLEDALFAEWPERLDLITRLTGTILIPQYEEPGRRSRATAYEDLAGQLRTTLDQFAIKRNFGFSIVSLVLMALIAAIGPLDYLLVNRLLGRPLLGWISFPLVAIGLSIILALQARPVAQADSAHGQTGSSGTQGLHANRVEIFDIDAIEGIGRGFAASYLYSHEAARFDLSVDESEMLASVSADIQQMITVPFGYPGESFGGIQIAVEDARLPVYQLPLEQNDDAGGSRVRSTMQALPLASRSSKGIATHCRFVPQLPDGLALQHRPGSELLRGELVNPLPLDLLEGMLVYRNWAYLLPTRFPANGRIASIDSLRQKNFRWQLSRQKALESATQTEAWDPTINDSPGRIAEMLMFHDTVGGSRYTTLRHDPLSFLDLSHVLAEDRCILIGRVASPMTNIRADVQGEIQQPSGSTLTLIRVVLPVEHARRD
jgi:hypothetical protein